MIVQSLNLLLYHGAQWASPHLSFTAPQRSRTAIPCLQAATAPAIQGQQLLLLHCGNGSSRGSRCSRHFSNCRSCRSYCSSSSSSQSSMKGNNSSSSNSSSSCCCGKSNSNSKAAAAAGTTSAAADGGTGEAASSAAEAESAAAATRGTRTAAAGTATSAGTAAATTTKTTATAARRTHRRSPGGPSESCACSARSATARFGWSEQRKAHVALLAHKAMSMLLSTI